jgi:hypothetical protein
VSRAFRLQPLEGLGRKGRPGDQAHHQGMNLKPQHCGGRDKRRGR